MKCGNTWYSSRDAISSLVIKTNAAPPNVGIAPWATSKFDEVEKDIQAGHAADAADHVPTETKSSPTPTPTPTDTITSPTPPPHHHYDEVENTLHEHLPVTNPTAEDFVNTNVQADEKKQTPLPKNSSDLDTENGKSRPPKAPEVTGEAKSELEISHVDGGMGNPAAENVATNGTSRKA